ncbi:hypothetical protein WMY93_028445 [Mugilogobius chulae]|uniref:Uncharacterized protein n=1 Tax=Mugilogobius chulae TaxID=88201 RepID=A0AAW0MUL3_9GOBI
MITHILLTLSSTTSAPPACVCVCVSPEHPQSVHTLIFYTSSLFYYICSSCVCVVCVHLNIHSLYTHSYSTHPPHSLFLYICFSSWTKQVKVWAVRGMREQFPAHLVDGPHHYEKAGDEFLKKVVTCDETWVWHFKPESNGQSMCGSPQALKKHCEQCELLRQVRKDIKNKCIGHQSEGVILPHDDNAKTHTAAQTTQTINQLGWELLPHPPYSPDLAPSDFPLFGLLKTFTRGMKFESHAEVCESVVTD